MKNTVGLGGRKTAGTGMTGLMRGPGAATSTARLSSPGAGCALRGTGNRLFGRKADPGLHIGRFRRGLQDMALVDDGDGMLEAEEYRDTLEDMEGPAPRGYRGLAPVVAGVPEPHATLEVASQGGPTHVRIFFAQN